MQEASYPTLAARYDIITAGVGPAAPGNRQSGINSGPTTSPDADGHVAITSSHGHFQNLMQGRWVARTWPMPALRTPMRAVAHMTSRCDGRSMDAHPPKMDGVFGPAPRLPNHLAPCAANARSLNDRTLQERGLLERIDHRVGAIVVPSTPLRLHGMPNRSRRPSPTIGQPHTPKSTAV